MFEIADEGQGTHPILHEMEINEITADSHIDYLLYKKKELEKKIEYNNEQIMKTDEFWTRKSEKVQKSIDWIDNAIREFVSRRDRKTFDMPNGVVRKRIVKSVSYPDSETLLKFSKENNIPTKIIEQPIKKEILDYIKSTGDSIDGIEFSERTNITINTV